MSEYCPTCKSEIGEWTDDPILTKNGLSGDSFKGFTPPKEIHITELQNYYNYLQTALLDENEKIIFSSVTNQQIRHIHIEQLRICIENILHKLNLTLSDYFGQINLTKNEWADTARVNKNDLSSEYGYIAGSTAPILTKNINIRAIHIEELRIGTTDRWLETFDVIDKPALDNTGSMKNIDYAYTPDSDEFKLDNLSGNHIWLINPASHCLAVNNVGGYAIANWNLKQSNSLFRILLNTSSVVNYPSAPEWFRSGAMVNTMYKSEFVNMSFSSNVKLILEGVNFSGSNAQVVIKIGTTSHIYKKTSATSSIPSKNQILDLWFFEQSGQVDRFSGYGGRVYTVRDWYSVGYCQPGVRLAYEQTTIVICGPKAWYSIGDIEIKITDALKYEWGSEVNAINLPTSIDKVGIGEEYIKNITIGQITIDALTSSRQFSEGNSESGLDFSINTIKFQ